MTWKPSRPGGNCGPAISSRPCGLTVAFCRNFEMTSALTSAAWAGGGLRPLHLVKGRGVPARVVQDLRFLAGLMAAPFLRPQQDELSLGAARWVGEGGPRGGPGAARPRAPPLLRRRVAALD